MKSRKNVASNEADTPILKRLIYYSYLLLFFLNPLLVSVKSTELFEFPKMLMVYAMTVLIVAMWVTDIAITGKVVWKKSWIDFVLVAVLLTQLLSSIFSIDIYTSMFGYYSRFHGGFWSTLCYVFLAWILKNYAKREWVDDLIMSSLASASLVSLYGIGEHFGIDASVWVQDVQNRVFSTLGQPNWLAAWLGALLPFAYLWFLRPPKSFWPKVISLNTVSVAISYALTFLLTGNPLPLGGIDLSLFVMFYIVLIGIFLMVFRKQNYKSIFIGRFNFLFIILLMQLAILFTKSRSGILALGISTGIFLMHELITSKKYKQLIPLVLSSIFLILVVGTEWTPSLAKIMGKSNQLIKNPFTAISSNPGISDSTDIRKVVWQGALIVWEHYPLFGSGTETFAYSYYNFRPKEHNLNSEWDFLYNKAHNEYLNFLANNGILGTAVIFCLILAIIWLSIRFCYRGWVKIVVFLVLAFSAFYLISPHDFSLVVRKLLIYPPLLYPLGVALVIALLPLIVVAKRLDKGYKASGMESAFLASLTSIVITNFYGFSVVTVAMLFFMLPVWILLTQENPEDIKLLSIRLTDAGSQSWFTWVLSGVAGISGLIFLLGIINYYRADLSYNYSQNYLRLGEVLKAGEEIDNSLSLHSDNANYWMQKGLVDAQTAFMVDYKDASDSSGLVDFYTSSAVKHTQEALLKNQVHVNLYKSAARVYITLGLIDPYYTQAAIKTLELAQVLSPTDPQIPLNIALLHQQNEQYQTAEELLKKAIELKPDYLQANFLLAQMYEEQKDYKRAAGVYQNVLDTLDPIDITSTQKLEEFRRDKLID